MTSGYKSSKPVRKCLRCGHKWTQRGSRKPRVCPNPRCHSLRWDIPRGDR